MIQRYRSGYDVPAAYRVWFAGAATHRSAAYLARKLNGRNSDCRGKYVSAACHGPDQLLRLIGQRAPDFK